MLELRRKLFHLSSLSLLAFSVKYLPLTLSCFLLLSSSLFLYLITKKHPLLYRPLESLVWLFEREKNRERPAVQAFWASAGGLLSCLIFGKEAFNGLLVLAVGDAFSGLTRYLPSRHSLPYNPQKSWEGSFFFFLFSSLALLPFEGEKAFLLALVGALTESLPLPPDDNFTVPLAVSFAGWLL